MDELKIDFDDPAVQHALAAMLVDPAFQWVFEMGETEKVQILENMVKDTVFEHVQAYYKQNPSASEGAAAPESKPAKDAAALPTVAEEDKEKEGDVEDPFAEWKGSEIQTCDDLVYELRLSNTTDQKMKYKVVFNEGAGVACNLVWPRQGLMGSIGPNERDVIVAMLPKKEAEAAAAGLSELQKLEVRLEGQEMAGGAAN